jgi:hypothetical protein
MKKIYFVILVLLTVQIINAQNSPWKTTGNISATPANFLGTIDKSDLIFKTNSVEYGRLTSAGLWRFGQGPTYTQVAATGKLTVGALHISFNGWRKRAGIKDKRRRRPIMEQ